MNNSDSEAWANLSKILDIEPDKWPEKVKEFFSEKAATATNIIKARELHEKLSDFRLLVRERGQYPNSDFLLRIGGEISECLKAAEELNEYKHSKPLDEYFSKYVMYGNKIFETLVPYYSYHLCLQDKTWSSSRKLMKRLDQKYEKILEDQAEIRSILKEAIDVKLTSYLGEYVEQFKEAKKEASDSSQMWQISLIIFTILGLAFVLLFIFFWPKPETQSFPVLLTYSVFPKVFIISIYTFVVAFCAKQYNAAKHNYLISSHRLCSLGTISGVNKLIEGAEKDIRGAVLLQALNTVLQHQPTGLNNQKGDTISSPIDDVIGILLKKGNSS